jgi:hypothetical protein
MVDEVMARVVMTVMMVALHGKGRRGKHHDQQGNENKLLHERNPSMNRAAEAPFPEARIKLGTSSGAPSLFCMKAA